MTTYSRRAFIYGRAVDFCLPVSLLCLRTASEDGGAMTNPALSFSKTSARSRQVWGLLAQRCSATAAHVQLQLCHLPQRVIKLSNPEAAGLKLAGLHTALQQSAGH